MLPTAKVLWPIRFASVPNIVVTVDAATETLALQVTADRDYWMSGDGLADDANGNGDLLAALTATLEQHTSGATWTVSLNTSFQLVIGLGGSVLTATIEWSNVFDHSSRYALWVHPR